MSRFWICLSGGVFDLTLFCQGLFQRLGQFLLQLLQLFLLFIPKFFKILRRKQLSIDARSKEEAVRSFDEEKIIAVGIFFELV